ncbi:MAG TPA: hypothetical protein VE968_06105 [Sphingomicrobium sp.]|nr:hypothetical protein [Sphingomicrobium sp.]
MRALLLIVILVIVVAIAAVMTGFVNITNIRGAPPELTATRNSVTAKGGQPPAFDVEAGTVKVGSKQTTVNVPTLEVQKPTRKPANATTNNVM